MKCDLTDGFSEYNQGRGNLYVSVSRLLYTIMARANDDSTKRGQKTPSFVQQGASCNDSNYEKSDSEAQNFVPTANLAVPKRSFCDELKSREPDTSPNSSQI